MQKEERIDVEVITNYILDTTISKSTHLKIHNISSFNKKVKATNIPVDKAINLLLEHPGGVSKSDLMVESSYLDMSKLSARLSIELKEKGNALRNLNKYDEAIEYFDKAIQINYLFFILSCMYAFIVFVVVIIGNSFPSA